MIKKINDFFCGCGGMGKGFVQAGWDIAGAWDWDKFAVKSYNANVGDHAEQADIKSLKWFNVPKATGWTFGFPCQDISRAKMEERKGLKGSKSGHFYEIMRLLRETQENEPENLPDFILAENVDELKSELPEIEKEYRERGYVMHVQLVNSKHWVPQSRNRYFVVGIRHDLPQNFVFPIEPEEEHSMLGVLDKSPDDGLYYTDVEYVEIGNRAFMPGELNVVGDIKKAGWLDYMGRVYSPFGVSPTLNTCQGGHRQAKILCPIREIPRKLSAMEYTRLQGFTDFVPVVSNAQIYKQMGNAVTVNVAESMASALDNWLFLVDKQTAITTVGRAMQEAAAGNQFSF